MSKTNSAPTIGWFATSVIYKWVTILFFIIVLIVTGMTIREIGIIDGKESCTDDRDIRIGKYHLLINIVNEKCK